MKKSAVIPLDLCYGSLALFQSILHNVFLLYHVDVFVSVYKIDKTSFWIGEAIFLIWNSLNDPLFGWISDRDFLSSTKRSKDASNEEIVTKRLRALQLNGPIFALSFILFWFPWGYAPLQFVICLCLYDGLLSMIDLHHSALLADLAISAEIRAKLNWKSSLFSGIGSLSVFLSYAIWTRDNLGAFRLFCLVLSVCSFVGFIVMTSYLQKAYHGSLKQFSYDNMDFLDHETREERSLPKVDFKQYLKQLCSQHNFILFSVMNFIQVFHCHFNSNFFPLFLDSLLGSSINPGFGSFLIGVSFIAPHINNLYFLSLCGRYGVYRVIKLLFCIKLAISLAMFCVGPNNIWMLCVFIASNRVFTEGTCKLLNLVITDLVDEDFAIHGRKKAVSALMFGTAAFLSKPGQTLAPLIGTWFLSQQTGHDIFQTGNEMGTLHVNKDTMSREMLELHRLGCFNLLVYIPIVCALVQLAVWMQFTLHGSKLRWIKSIRAGAEHSII